MTKHITETITYRNGERIVEVRSAGGKLLFVKTKEGYEMKCPRTKKICLIDYKDMISDCLKCWADIPSGRGNPFFGEPENKACNLVCENNTDSKIIR